MRISLHRSAQLLVAALCGFYSGTVAQIPNSGFESWSGGNPVGWQTSNDTAFSVNVTQTSASHSGASAAHGVVTTFGGGFPWIPTLTTGENGEGFPVNARHLAVRGWYKFSPLGSDEIWVSTLMTKADTGVGAGLTILSGAQATYREFVLNIFYIDTVVPDTCIISFALLGPGGGLPTVGSAFDVDDLFFGAPSAVEPSGPVIPSSFKLLQNYPNPFNPSTTIPFYIARGSHVKLGVYDALGREVAVLVDEPLDAGSYKVAFDGRDLASGVYFYRLVANETHSLRTGGFSQTRTLVILK